MPRTWIIIHKSPDMDALVAAYIYMQELNLTIDCITFASVYDQVPESIDLSESKAVYLDMTPIEPPVGDNVVIVDHHYGRNAMVTAEIVWKSFSNRPYYRILVEEAGVQDRAHDRRKIGVRFRDVLIGIKAQMYRENRYSDREFMRTVFWLFDSIIEKEKRSLDAVNDVSLMNISYVNEGPYLIAYYEGTVSPYVRRYLFGKEDVSFIVYSEGFNIGIIRNAELDRPDLRQLEDLLSKEAKEQAGEWFFHSDGFLAARGTHNNPARSESNVSLSTLVGILTLFLRGG